MMKFREEYIFRLFTVLLMGAMLPTASIAQTHEPASATYSPASNNHEFHAKPSAPRLLTEDEGLAVLGAALESRKHSDAGADCSHLVHAIYQRAGFAYTYANSSSLYAGTEEFRRVTRPQPGDLVVWPGHVGIAVSPAQHTFFSALRSGRGVEPYDTAFWKGRGRPRFLRYVTNAPTSIPAAPFPADPSDREARLKTASSSEPVPSITRNLSFEVSEEPQTDADPASSIPVAKVHGQRPAPGEVTAALEQILSNNAGLHGLDMLNPGKPLIVFDKLSVERVRLQRDRGWAEVRLTGALKLSKQKTNSAQKTNSTKHDEKQRWLLVRHDHDSWEIVLPYEAIYIPSDVAVRTLAHQLSALTDQPELSNNEGSNVADAKLQLSRLLNLSLEKSPASRP